MRSTYKQLLQLSPILLKSAVKVYSLFSLLGIVSFQQSFAHQVPPVAPTTGYTLRWLGTAGWKLTYQNQTILIDPYLSRKSNKEIAKKKYWESKESSINFSLEKAKIEHVDGIFVSSSHYDHLADVPFLAKKFPKTTVYGSTTTCNILKAMNPSSKCVNTSIEKQIHLSTLNIKIIPSLHSFMNPNKEQYLPGTVQMLPKTPLGVDDFLEGGNSIFYFEGEGIHLLYQGSANFVEKELAGLHPQIAILASENAEYIPDYQKTLLGVMHPKKIFLNHFDDFQLPYSAGVV